MIRPIDDETPGADDPSTPADDSDERVGEAIEIYLGLIEQGEVPDPERFAARYPDIEEDVLAALHGLELVNGLVGHLPGGSSSNPSAQAGAPGRSLESGRRIAGYRIVRELGRGGMGAVYEAVHIALDRPVALKILGSHAAPDSSARRRFLNEARTAARLHHTNIVPVFDVGQVGGLCYYAMQRIEGTGLDHVLRRQRRLRSQLGGSPSSLAIPGDDVGKSRVAITPASPSNSSQSSRLGQFWFRVSAGWLKRPIEAPAAAAPGGIDRPGPPPPASRRAPGGLDLGVAAWTADVARDNPTGSWNGQKSAEASRRRSRTGHDQDASGLALSSAPPRGDFLPGRAESLDEEAPFSPPRGSAYYRWVAEVGLQSAEALAHAHHQGVIHRDVKPSNLLIDAKGTVWVTDFGLARRLADPGLTQHDSMLGTPRYMSPEQARPGAIDGRADIFSLGGTLYELLTLRPAFDGKSAAELVEQIARQDPSPPRSIDPRIPRDLETIVLKTLAKRPADRYSSAASLADDLARFLNHEPVKARRISPVGRLWRVARRHPGITGVSTVAAATILAVATYAHIRVVNALDKYLGQLRTSHWQNAALVRLSPGMPGRTAHGLDLIKKAADLDPEPGLKQKLRDEVVDFLALRDVEKIAELETGRVRGLLFAGREARLAAISEAEEGEQLTFWDIDRRLQGEPIPLSIPPRPANPGGDSRSPVAQVANPPAGPTNEAAPGEERNDGATSRRSTSIPSTPPPDGPGRRTVQGSFQGGFGRRGISGRMALAGRTLAVILVSDPNSRLEDAVNRTQLFEMFGLALARRSLGATAAFDRSLSAFRDRGLRLFDAETGAWVRDLRTPQGNVVGVFGGPRNRHLVTVDQEFLFGRPGEFQRRFHVNLWDPESPATAPVALELPRTDNPPNTPGSSPCVGFSPDGEKVALGWGTLVTIFSAKDGTPLGRVDTQAPLTALAIGPNDLMATAGGGNVRLWDLGSQTFLSSLTPAQNVIATMRFSPDGSALALVGRDDSTIELIDPIGRSQIAILRASDRISDLAFSPDGQALSAGSGSSPTTTVWKILRSPARAQLSGFDDQASSLAFRKDGLLAVGTANGEIWGCRLPSPAGTKSCTPLFANSEARTRLAPTAAEILASRVPTPAGPSESSGLGGSPRSRELLLDRPAERGPGVDRDQRANRDRSQAIILAYDDRDRLVVAHDADPLQLWPGKEGARSRDELISLPLPRINALQRSFQYPALSRAADGRSMLVYRGSRFFLWQSDAPETLLPISPPGSEREPGWGSESSNVPPASREVVRTKSSPTPSASPSGRGARTGGGRFAGGFRYGSARLAPAGDRIYVLDYEAGIPVPQVWDLIRDGDSLRARRVEWPSPPQEIVSLALSPDGGLLAMGNRAGGIALVETGGLQSLGSIEPAEPEGGGPVQAMGFSPDGLSLAVASQRGPVYLWSLRKRTSSGQSGVIWETRFHLRLPAHRSPVRLLAFDARGSRLAGAGTDPLVEVWNLDEIREELARLGLDDD